MMLTREEIEQIAAAAASAAVEQERASRLSHPEERRRVTKFQAPDGREWISTTLEKAELWKRVILLIVFAGSIMGGVLGGYYEVVVLPREERRIAEMIHQHELDAQARMEVVAKKYALDSDLQVLRAEKAQKWEDQDKFNARIEAALVEMQRDIKELLRRSR
jgi:hypothetical protein